MGRLHCDSQVGSPADTCTKGHHLPNVLHTCALQIRVLLALSPKVLPGGHRHRTAVSCCSPGQPSSFLTHCMAALARTDKTYRWRGSDTDAPAQQQPGHGVAATGRQGPDQRRHCDAGVHTASQHRHCTRQGGRLSKSCSPAQSDRCATATPDTATHCPEADTAPNLLMRAIIANNVQHSALACPTLG